MNREKFSNELKDTIDYMIDTLQEEFPTNKVGSEYILLALLDTKCHVSVLLDRFVMTSNIGEIRAIYERWIEENQLKVKNFDKSKTDYTEFENILLNADIEREKMGMIQLCTEHVLLTMLTNNFSKTSNVKQVFETMGITYEFLYSKFNRLQEQQEQNAQLIQEVNKTIPSKSIPSKSEVNKKNVATSTKYISQFTININQLIDEGKIDPLVGRENEVNQIIKILARRKKNNAVLVGQSGCGKSSIINGLAARIAVDNVPPSMMNKEVIKLNIMALVSGTHFRGMLEERVNSLFNELKQNDKYILFLDDIHTMLKSSSKEKDTDISSYIADILTNGDVKVVATCGFKDYRNTIEINPQIQSKFQKVIIEPNTKEEALTILQHIKPLYEQFHNVRYSNEVLKKTVELAERFNTQRSLPDSAIDILDLSGAYTCLVNKEPKEITQARKELINIHKEKEKLLNNGDFETVNSLTETENHLKRQIITYTRTFSANLSQYTVDITPDDIITATSELTNVPINQLKANDKEKLAHIEDTLKNFVVGQDEAVETVCKVVKRSKVGLSNKNKPLANILLLGPTGVGKTLLAKKLASEVFGSENDLVRIDMSEYSEKASVSKLIGASSGYIGYENGGILTEAVKNKQHCVLLLDEIEKANEEVYNIFLQLFDEGRLTDNAGTTVSFKNVIVLMTSNTGAKESSSLSKSTGFISNTEENSKAITEKSLKKTFKPEFLNRLDKIVYFNNLTDDNYKNIIKLEINYFNKRLNEIKYNFVYEDSVIDFIFNIVSKERNMGGRPILRCIQDYIEDEITTLLLANDYDENYEFKATVENNKIVIK